MEEDLHVAKVSNNDPYKISFLHRLTKNCLGLTAMSSSTLNACDHQIVDVLNDHLCYVVSYVKSPWHLPRPESFRLRSKVVVTHVSKFQCRLAIYIRVDWFGSSRPWRGE